jgi:hypothetical protein
MKASEFALVLGGIGLQAGLCVLLILKGFQRPFRSFFAYTLFSVLASSAGLALRNHLTAYFYFYWISELIYIVLGLAALHEIIHVVFRNFYAIRWFRLLFPAVGAAMIVTAVLRTALVSRSGAPLESLFEMIVSLEILVRLFQFGLLALFFVLIWFFHMRWQQIPLGIALGFGVAAAGFLVVFLLRSEFGTKFNSIVRITPPMTYIAAVVVWLATFLRAEPSQPVQEQLSALKPQEIASELRRYTRAVKGFLGR